MTKAFAKSSLATRRRILKSGLAASLLPVCLPGLSGFARAGTTDASGRRFAFVILRGAMDGLAAVPPLGDPAYRRTRGILSLDAAIAPHLDGDFGLHRTFAFLRECYDADDALMFHAIASPYRERSHFDGQDMLETGSAGRPGEPMLRDGWLARALESADRKAGVGPARAVAIARTMPLALTGSRRAGTWSPSHLPEPGGNLFERLAMLYEDDPLLRDALDMARQSAALTDGLGMPGKAGRGGQAFSIAAKAAGRFLSADDGPDIAVLELSGWDTHANQGTAEGQLARQFAALDQGLKSLKTALGPAWRRTAILCLTEFGRTARPNGTGGTDHGTASAGFLLGGAVAGGRIVADWPGLSAASLFEERDLRPTLSTQRVLKAVLQDHLGLPADRVDSAVFPGTADRPALGGLFRIT
ncbi:MAG: DUF1501 domain-containing protein [Rhodospirillales bacterium]|nr:MAG: DUF1501 domain-containing protein [Rhodospirillales bacterium]